MILLHCRYGYLDQNIKAWLLAKKFKSKYVFLTLPCSTSSSYLTAGVHCLFFAVFHKSWAKSCRQGKAVSRNERTYFSSALDLGQPFSCQSVPGWHSNPAVYCLIILVLGPEICRGQKSVLGAETLSNVWNSVCSLRGWHKGRVEDSGL